MRSDKNKMSKRRMGIRGKLILCFVAFAVLMLSITWIFQIGLLNKFYERTKHGELDYAADSLADAVATGDFEETAALLGSEYGICVRIFSITGSTLAEESVSVKADPPFIIA